MVPLPEQVVSPRGPERVRPFKKKRPRQGRSLSFHWLPKEIKSSPREISNPLGRGSGNSLRSIRTFIWTGFVPFDPEELGLPGEELGFLLGPLAFVGPRALKAPGEAFSRAWRSLFTPHNLNSWALKRQTFSPKIRRSA